NGLQRFGLGVYIVRLVARFHGGATSAANLAAGGGVRMSVRIPRGRPLERLPQGTLPVHPPLADGICRQIETWYFRLESVQSGAENTVRTIGSGFCRVERRGGDAKKLRGAGRIEGFGKHKTRGSTRARVTTAANLLQLSGTTNAWMNTRATQ